MCDGAKERNHREQRTAQDLTPILLILPLRDHRFLEPVFEASWSNRGIVSGKQ
jgi:hypothetical protein